MLAGEAVVAIWNDIAPEMRDAFYEWHIHEHMPERVGIPGFRRGRRFIAADDSTRPEFFTLYEADTMQVLQGSDYANRLNAPTPGTRAVTAQFRNTSRALARVVSSRGPGCGGVVLTVSFTAKPESESRLADALHALQVGSRVTGVHLCTTDPAASGVSTAETRVRTGNQEPPGWFVLLEASDTAALSAVPISQALQEAGVAQCEGRMYRLEYERLKTAFGAG